jgi:hypothetical protein
MNKKLNFITIVAEVFNILKPSHRHTFDENDRKNASPHTLFGGDGSFDRR